MRKHVFYLSMVLILTLFLLVVVAKRVCLLRLPVVVRMKFW